MKQKPYQVLGCLLLILFLSLLGSGCALYHPVHWDEKTSTEWKASVAQPQLAMLSPRVRAAVVKILIVDDYRHFSKTIDEEVAHCHGDGTICLRLDCLTAIEKEYVLWHEAGHAYLDQLRVTTDFMKKWQAIPRASVTEYGKTNLSERFAEYFREFHLFVNDRPSAFSDLETWAKRLYNGRYDKNAYRECIRLMHEYRCFQEKDYQKFLSKNPFKD